jgi:ribosomal protein L35
MWGRQSALARLARACARAGAAAALPPPPPLPLCLAARWGAPLPLPLPHAAAPLHAARGFAASAACCASRAAPRQPLPPPSHPGAAPAGVRGYAKALQVGGKMKLPSSFKERFKRTANGHFMRMRVGKRHCASAKSRPQRRRLRKKALVPAGRAAIMRKLGFSFKGSGR